MPEPADGASDLDGPAVAELTTAIEDAFNVAELDELIVFTFSKGLFVEYVPEGLPGHYVTLQLIQALERRGTVEQFLRAVRKARPDKAPLLATIARLCPPAMADPAAVGTRMADVLGGLNALRGLSADPRVRQLVKGSQDNLVQLATDLRTLRGYKGLHDALQRVQVVQYRELLSNVARLRAEPMVAQLLGSLILQLNMACENARNVMDNLPDTPRVRRRETLWIGKLADAITTLDAAVQKLDDLPAKLSVSTIGDVIRTEPPRINYELRDAAENLPVQSLIQTLQDVAALAGLTPAQKAPLDNATAGLNSLWARLRQNVTEHDNWQEVETQLWGTDFELQHVTPAVSEQFKAYWIKAQDRIGILWRAEPEAPWVVDTKRWSDQVEQAMGIDFAQTQRSYGDFRNGALFRFFRVDGALNLLCEQVLRISEPLSAVLSGLDA